MVTITPRIILVKVDNSLFFILNYFVNLFFYCKGAIDTNIKNNGNNYQINAIPPLGKFLLGF